MTDRQTMNPLFTIVDAAGEPTGPATTDRASVPQLLDDCRQLSGEIRDVVVWVDDTLPHSLACDMTGSDGSDRLTPGLITMRRRDARVRGYATQRDIQDIIAYAEFRMHCIDCDGGPDSIGQRSYYSAARAAVRRYRRLMIETQTV